MLANSSATKFTKSLAFSIDTMLVTFMGCTSCRPMSYQISHLDYTLDHQNHPQRYYHVIAVTKRIAERMDFILKSIVQAR